MTSISICSLPILVPSYLVENDEPFWIISLCTVNKFLSSPEAVKGVEEAIVPL